MADQQIALAVETVPIDSLRPHARNYRAHPEDQLEHIVESIREHGFYRNVVIARDGTILAGHGVVEAVQSMGGTEVPVVRLDLDPDEPRALKVLVGDNQIALLGGIDDQALGQMLKEIRDTDLDGLLGTGYDEMMLDTLLSGIGALDAAGGGSGEDPGPQIDRAEELREKWQTERGQLWLIGKHRLLCGDSTSADDVARLMSGERAALLVTSPPYNQGIDKFRPSGMHREGDWVAKVERLAYADSLPEAEYQAQQSAALRTWHQALADGASVFYNHKNRYRDKQVVSPMAWLPGPFRLRQEIVWSRPGSVTQNARMFLPSDERIYWMYKGEDFYFDDSTEIKSYSTVWDIALETNKDHAVAFPIELPSRCIGACSRPGDVVFDPYVGSGTTMVAAEQLGRSCYGSELAPGVVAVALERLAQMGLEPRRG